MIFIPIYGIEGSAFATLLTVMIYNTIKLFYVINKMNLYPFTIKTIYSLVIIIVSFLLFYFWDFTFHPIINIGLKSILIGVFYMFFTYKFQISEEVNQVVNSLIVRISRMK
jgi:hypothetical protein